ncbi:MAG: carboxypeptidase-like regulatory domain-containing protein [Ignavibacteria bacterium]
MIYGKFYAGTFLFLVTLIVFQSCSDDGVTPVDGHVWGLVVNGNGNPIPDLVVKIGDQSTVTDRNGTYNLNDIETPYDVLIKDESSRSQMLIKSVTSREILVPDFLSSYNPDFKAYVNVNIPSSIIQSGKKGKLIFTDGGGVNSSTDITGESTILEVKLVYNSVQKGKLIVLIYSVDAAGRVYTYNNYASKTGIDLSNGSTNNSFSFDMNELSYNPPERIINGSINIPAGYNSSSQYYYLSFADRNISFNDPSCKISDITGDNFNIVVPYDLPDIFSVMINNYSNNSDKYSLETFVIHDYESSVNLSSHHPVDLISPANNNSGITSNSEISFSQGDGTGVYAVRFIKDGYMYSVITSETSFPISELEKFDIGNISNEHFTWTVQKYGHSSGLKEYLNIIPISEVKFVSKSEQWMFQAAP